MRKATAVILSLKLGICLLGILLVSACGTSSSPMAPENKELLRQEEMEIQDSTAQIKLVFSAEPKGAVGYGYLFRCKVEGGHDIGQDSFFMTILVSDKGYHQVLTSTSKKFEGTFRKGEEKVAYKRMPISGFVDNDMTSWLLQDLKALQE